MCLPWAGTFLFASNKSLVLHFLMFLFFLFFHIQIYCFYVSKIKAEEIIRELNGVSEQFVGDFADSVKLLRGDISIYIWDDLVSNKIK